ncbi:unnamed protein product [Prorocentrum cordatum]|uniref:Protein xylosyltransferase n=1 Tax=Prorocentrum cordatum TaxID=2364126 RepID=A0ABN9V2L0_9DINO|nr:unnamed protein product [Polarella glacialis]
MAGAAKTLRLPYHIKCHNAACDSYNYGSSRVAMYGGHAAWLEASRHFALSGKNDANGMWTEGVKQLSCITNFREAVSRIQSCYYYRFLKLGAPRCLGDMGAGEMWQFFLAGRSQFGYSCMNEPFRMLSGMVDESLFNSDTESQGWDFAFNSTRMNLAHCVPIISSSSYTLDVVASWFPDLIHITRFSKAHANKGHKPCKISERHMEVLADLTRHERRLYDLAAQRANQFLSSMPHRSHLGESGGGGAGQQISSRGAGPLAPLLSIEDAARAFLQAPLPPRVDHVSVERPLVFIHQRKAGGTSLRGIMAGAAKTLSLPCHIKCHNAACDSYSYGSSRVAMYGGHVAWLEASRHFALSGKNDANGMWTEGVKQLSCITNFREAVSRIQSCYDYRFLKLGAPRCLGDMGADEMCQFFLAGRSQFGYSCMNEPFRMLSGLVDEPLFISDTESQEWDFAFNSTLMNIAHCVSIIISSSSTLDVVASWFPDLISITR